MPVAAVIMPVAVAVFVSANGIMRFKTHGYMAPLAMPSGTMSAVAIVALPERPMSSVTSGMAMMDATRIL